LAAYFEQILSAKGIEFDGRKFEYIGVPSVDDSVCALTKASGVTNMETWLAAKEPLKLGGIGPGGTLSDVARTLKAALGLPIRVVDGYKGVADARLAADAGELAGYCGGLGVGQASMAQGYGCGPGVGRSAGNDQKKPGVATGPVGD
jgi:hypothetical protein